MKKTAIFLSILAIAATAAFVATADDAVYSANTIGVIKYTIPAGGELTCISLPVDYMEGSDWTFADTPFADALPKGSSVYFWSGTGWDSSTKNVVSGKWLPAAPVQKAIKQGEGFFVQLPANSEAKEIAIVGELPMDGAVTNKITGGGNLDMTSATFYPVDVVFGETELADKLPKGSTVYFWSGTGWDSTTKNVVSGKWLPAAPLERKIGIGEAIFVEGKTATDVVVECPYDL